MASITSFTKISDETRKVIEELIGVFGLPEECVLVSSPDVLKIKNKKQGHILGISTFKGLPPQFSGNNSYRRMVDMKTIAIPMKLIKVVGITILCSIIFLLVFFITKEIIKRDIKGEAEQVKTEFIDKTVNFNDTAAAKVVATTIHKFSAFKDKVKKELKTLDSADKK